MTDHATDFAICTAFAVALFAVIVVGGLYNPNTLAGAVARFVFSLHA